MLGVKNSIIIYEKTYIYIHIYIYIYNNKSGKTVSKELNENSEH